ncbi:hypothetical protein ACU635_41455 [[Actinomadura] parvosata]|uniref:hypothetical protein n=1 Tax=[Actinomadura] parvosata TaxID=1955412 RepID=UPI00406C12C3
MLIPYLRDRGCQAPEQDVRAACRDVPPGRTSTAAHPDGGAATEQEVRTMPELVAAVRRMAENRSKRSGAAD